MLFFLHFPLIIFDFCWTWYLTWCHLSTEGRCSRGDPAQQAWAGPTALMDSCHLYSASRLVSGHELSKEADLVKSCSQFEWGMDKVNKSRLKLKVPRGSEIVGPLSNQQRRQDLVNSTASDIHDNNHKEKPFRRNCTYKQGFVIIARSYPSINDDAIRGLQSKPRDTWCAVHMFFIATRLLMGAMAHEVLQFIQGITCYVESNCHNYRAGK